MPRNKNRSQVSLEVMLDFSSGKNGARVSDLSLTGCFVDSIVQVSEGEKLTLTLNIPERAWLALPGEVVYVLPGTGFGVRFTDLDENRLRELEYAVRNHGGDPWGKDIVAE